MAYVFGESSRALLKHLQADPKTPKTADMIAKEMNVSPKVINGTATALSRKNLVKRIEMEGFEKKVIAITAAGLEVDPDAEKPEAEE